MDDLPDHVEEIKEKHKEAVNMAKACEEGIFVLLVVETLGIWTPFAIKLLWVISVSSCYKMFIVILKI